jgi:hypothetical protein
MALFEQLAAIKEEIEANYGAPLVWEDLPSKRACRIADYGQGDVSNGDQFDEYIDWFFDSGSRLRTAIGAAARTLAMTTTPADDPSTSRTVGWFRNSGQARQGLQTCDPRFRSWWGTRTPNL